MVIVKYCGNGQDNNDHAGGGNADDRRNRRVQGRRRRDGRRIEVPQGIRGGDVKLPGNGGGGIKRPNNIGKPKMNNMTES